MTLSFLSPSRCEPGTTESPLRRALERADPSAVRDRSVRGIVEVRGDLGRVQGSPHGELVRLSPRRGFVFTGDDPVETADALRERGVLAYDATGALAGVAIASERVLRRLTDLDLERLPTAGAFARVTAIVRRDDAGWFEVYVQQELGHYVAEAVLDALAGVAQ